MPSSRKQASQLPPRRGWGPIVEQLCLHCDLASTTHTSGRRTAGRAVRCRATRTHSPGWQPKPRRNEGKAEHPSRTQNAHSAVAPPGSGASRRVRSILPHIRWNVITVALQHIFLEEMAKVTKSCACLLHRSPSVVAEIPPRTSVVEWHAKPIVVDWAEDAHAAPSPMPGEGDVQEC